ncbi:MAG TPA: DUF4190 domain-containing protein, partial [Pirellulaceae bacterium]|nr:DUF4190 domain-containing protein [Pirellulaceae bacterium]
MQFSIGGTCSVIIYGMRTTESTLGQGLFACPNCRTQQACRHVVMNRWFTLYFIPVIPLGNIGEQFECQGCYARFTADAPGMTPGMAPALTPGSPTTPQPAAGPAWSGQPYAPQAAGPPTAPFATLSLVLGLISPVLLCACGLSALTSLGAIISGHIALAKIAKSKGVLTGRGMAISGLVLGYVLLAFSILFWVRLGPSIFRAGDRAERGAANADVAQTPEDRLLETELRVLTASTEGVATGNTRAAKEIAGEYAESLKSMRDDLFTKDRERVLSLTDGHFIVHCELHADRCALIVHVPGYRDFTSDAKKTLEELAWILAQKAAQ